MFTLALFAFIPAVIAFSLLKDNIIAKRDAEWSKAAAPIFMARQIPMKPTDPEGLSRLLDKNNDFVRNENGRMHKHRQSVVRVTFAE